MLGGLSVLSPLRALRRADRFVGFYFGGRLDERNLRTVLERLPARRTTELMCHPGFDDPASRYGHWDYAWAAETAALSSPRIKEMLDARGVRLIGYRELDDTSRKSLMDEAEFDKFAAEYRTMHAANIKISGEDPEYFAEYKVIDIANEVAQRAPRPPRVLDFGAGVGYSVPFFARHLPGARVTCLDVSRKSLELGAQRYPGQAEFTHFDGAAIPYDTATFDVALASCVFHHIPQTSTSHCSAKSGACSSPTGCCSSSSTIR